MNHSASKHTPVSGPVTPPYKQEKKSGAVKEVLSTVGILLLAPLAAIILTVFVFQFYRVDGPSMEQTLHNNDRLIVFKLPKTWARLTKRSYIPERDEIIVFNRLEEDGTERQLIKRVIGLPGDHVIVKDNKVIIYNVDHPDGFDPDAGKDHQPYTVPTAGNVDLTVPEGQVFVLGDNRKNSLDSRRFGTIHADDIIGRLASRVYPFKPVGD